MFAPIFNEDYIFHIFSFCEMEELMELRFACSLFNKEFI